MFVVRHFPNHNHAHSPIHAAGVQRKSTHHHCQPGHVRDRFREASQSARRLRFRKGLSSETACCATSDTFHNFLLSLFRQTPGVGSIARHGSLSGSTTSEIPDQPSDRAPSFSSASRRDSQVSQSSQSSRSQAQQPARTQQQSSVVDEAEDTMKNLRKTFAGIFGDM